MATNGSIANPIVFWSALIGAIICFVELVRTIKRMNK